MCGGLNSWVIPLVEAWEVTVLECPLLASVTKSISGAQASAGWTEPEGALLCSPLVFQVCQAIILGTGRWHPRRETMLYSLCSQKFVK